MPIQLTPEQKQQLSKALNELIPELEKEIARAKAARLDVADLERQLVQAKAQLKAIQEVYG